MKKIPTLFRRVFDHNHVIEIIPDVTPGFEWPVKNIWRDF